MAVSEFTTYEQKGIMEDVSSIITNLTPYDTPFLSSIGTEKVHNTKFEWQEDSLRAGAANAKTEGHTASVTSSTATTVLDNHTQIVSETFGVTGTADAVKTYGRAKQTAYEMAKVMKSLKKDVEYMMVGASQAKASGSNAATETARKSASYENLLVAKTTSDDKSNVVNAGTAAATLANLTGTHINTLHKTIFERGGQPNILMVTPRDALVVANLAEQSNRSRVLNDKITEVVHVVDVYQTPFGRLNVVINRHLQSSQALMYDSSMWSACYLRPFTHVKLGQVGDQERHMVVAELGLKTKARDASGYVRWIN